MDPRYISVVAWYLSTLRPMYRTLGISNDTRSNCAILTRVYTCNPEKLGLI